MAADITTVRPGLYRALIDAGWTFRPLNGGGGVFSADDTSLAVRRGGRCELWRQAATQLAVFPTACPDPVVAAAAIALQETST